LLSPLYEPLPLDTWRGVARFFPKTLGLFDQALRERQQLLETTRKHGGAPRMQGGSTTLSVTDKYQEDLAVIGTLETFCTGESSKELAIRALV
jgi:phage gpG-like protein